jgi:hypothetical protein
MTSAGELPEAFLLVGLLCVCLRRALDVAVAGALCGHCYGCGCGCVAGAVCKRLQGCAAPTV